MKKKSAGHAPRPWQVVIGEQKAGPVSRDRVLYIRDANNKAVTIPQQELVSWPVKDEEAARIEASARLMAAAPELLALLAEGVQRLEDIGHPTGLEDTMAWAQDARAAIAKAEGRK